MKYNVKLKNWKRLDRSRAYCLLTNKKGKILAGTADGLFTIENDSFKDEFRNKDPFLKRRIDFMIENYDGTIILAAKNEGIYLFNNNQLKFIDVYNQYQLNYIKGIYLQDKNKVWLNTSKGVFILSINNNNAKVVDIINKFDGLPDDEINDILFLNGEVFFIYSNSIVKFKNKLSPERTTSKFKPFLENLMVHNTNHPVSDSMLFTSEQNNLMLKFIALDYAQNGKLNYQY